ncbi:nicotinate-nucleotide--dimethylbenzimidazole phosphoribosyltransferase [Persicobacter psychrovividus]|uniref:Nicotinate-nucleotide--dimethylbenzimidazole phosphoribosyltransferase n=1 Tax=Persicobacter psychrovividus TaxID=387638 RepID=A0ABM7VE99_9BACT|nr:nicotinate-nucleotide--dimethylbenzimidazole phosphoribosyltransferase [Persicobacter psychrovividus]
MNHTSIPTVSPLNLESKAAIQHKIDQKIKPVGSLGLLESIALKVALIQETEAPEISNPHLFVFAADHGITAEGVSPFPSEVTPQMVLNFLSGGAGINAFANRHGWSLKVVDAGVNFDFEAHPLLVDAKVKKGTGNFLKAPAMSESECLSAFVKASALVQEAKEAGANTIAFGEMGIGNTTTASLLMAKVLGLSGTECAGKGTGANEAIVARKAEVIDLALEKYADLKDPLAILSAMGGLEIAMVCGAMLEAAAQRMLIVVDGFIITSALLMAEQLCPEVLDYCVFAHQSNEQGHQKMLKHFNATPILQLGLRLGEGTGAALALPMIQSAVDFLNQMNSFETGGVATGE